PALFACPPHRTWDSVETLLDDTNVVAKDLGFCIVKRRASNYDNHHKPKRYDLVCAEGREAVSRGTWKRPNRETCPWRAKAVRFADIDEWHFTVMMPSHCHAPDPVNSG
ncbi:hypothetical protein C8A01DRAFT_21503, partial [Parachaetomium inaequale]